MSTRTHARAGYTLLEVAFAAAIGAGLLYAVAYTSLRASRAYEEGQVRASLVADAHQVVGRIVSELDGAGETTLGPAGLTGLGSGTITFQKVTGYAAGAVTWSAQSTIAWTLDPNELADGTDNDADGLIDEGQILLTRDVGQPTEITVVLCHGVSELMQGEVANLGDDNGNGLVDEPGLVFELQGTVLIVRLSLEDRDRDGNLLVKTVQTAVRIRN